MNCHASLEEKYEKVRSFTQYADQLHALLTSDCSFEATLPTLTDKSMSFVNIGQWATPNMRDPDPEQRQTYEFLDLCMELDPNKCVPAEEALRDLFLSSVEEGQHLDDEIIFA